MTSLNGWNEWSKHVLAELQRHNELLETLRNEVASLTTVVGVQRVKISLLGMAAGCVPSAFLVILYLVFRG